MEDSAASNAFNGMLMSKNIETKLITLIQNKNLNLLKNEMLAEKIGDELEKL